ncbi:hypothetical protein MCG98_10940 [Ruminococcus sp. OA3]|uniref:hypothetical protein n=1 Tax=Ruminococcus sp. OA3 TaxID=2914164 RepID=UPI001F05AB44|nr:hypothetical protein [Ruminococcus sp. OA3]MCH1983081.1 hypothetical protein [Ruminococcus sp. OA3]
MLGKEQVKEIREAIEAGQRALESLEIAQESLQSAGNWGIFDMLGGGFFSTMIKHSKIEDSQSALEEAKYHLGRLRDELRDIEVPLDLRMDVNGFLTFADFFFDGLIADWMVQSRITDAREQVDDAIQKVQMIMSDLKHWEQNLLLEDRRND